jgi:hypothetical protein
MLLSLCQFVLAFSASAAPYIPASESQVLERLPFKANDPIAREMGQLRADLGRDPNNADTAVALAWRYYELVAEEGDPRYLGYAQAALATLVGSADATHRRTGNESKLASIHA